MNPTPITYAQDTRLNDLRMREFITLTSEEVTEYLNLASLVAANLRWRWNRSSSLNHQAA